MEAERKIMTENDRKLKNKRAKKERNTKGRRKTRKRKRRRKRRHIFNWLICKPFSLCANFSFRIRLSRQLQ